MFAAIILAEWLCCARLRGEDHLDYRFSYYQEEAGRIRVATQSGLIEAAPADWLSVKAQVVYDAISGASPTGILVPAGEKLTLANGGLGYLTDIRRAGDVVASLRFGKMTLRPEISYSIERDYESKSIGLSASFDFNQRNTTLTLGVSHDFDEVFPNRPGLGSPHDPAFQTGPTEWRKTRAPKDTTDILVGVTQVLTPGTLLTANFTVGESHGYLGDPYKFAEFQEMLVDPCDGSITILRFHPDERRPRQRVKEVGFLSLNQNVARMNASVEVSYRLYHDSFDVWSHTASLQWFQKLGRHVILAPLLRVTEQSAASFYAPVFSGVPSDRTYFSSDYRLASLNTVTAGIEATIFAAEWLHLNFSYFRYEMRGNHAGTPADTFPKANIFTAGLRLWF